MPSSLPQSEAALRARLDQPGLEPAQRCLLLGMASVWPQDEACLALCIAVAREQRASRADWEEMLLQAVLFCGFPRVINAFGVFAEAWPGPPQAAVDLRDAEQRRSEGAALFAQIYAANREPVEAMLQQYQPSLHEFVMDAAYAGILTRPGLPAATRELLAIAVLAFTDQVPQLIAHARGALRCGAGAAQVEAALATVLNDPADVAALLRRIVKRGS